MIAAFLSAAALLAAGAPPQPGAAQQALVIHSLGQVVIRIDPDGFVQARSCDGRLQPVGNLASPPRRIRIGHDGSVSGFAFSPRINPAQRASFQRMMLAFGYSDWRALSRACLPSGSVSAAQDLERAGIGSSLEVIR